jgi:Zn-dependent M16 (insulinase) family peptidase
MLEFLNTINKEKIEIVCNNLERISNFLLLTKPKILITSELNIFDKVFNKTKKYFENIPKVDIDTLFVPTKKIIPKFPKTFINIPSSISFTSQAYLTVPYFDKESTFLKIVANIINSNYLHKEIREIGGAYGILYIYFRYKCYAIRNWNFFFVFIS